MTAPDWPHETPNLNSGAGIGAQVGTSRQSSYRPGGLRSSQKYGRQMFVFFWPSGSQFSPIRPEIMETTAAWAYYGSACGIITSMTQIEPRDGGDWMQARGKQENTTGRG